MTHPQFSAADGFARLPLGKLPPRDDPRTLRFARYIDDAVLLPFVPETADWASGVAAWPMYGNDRLGDCTCAAAGHMVEAWTRYAKGATFTPADADVEHAYIPGTGTDDTGRFELDVLNYWRNTGIGSDRIGAYAAIDPSNLDHIRAAIYLFGGVYVGVALPTSAQGQTFWDVVGDGKTGPSQPGSWGGHAIPYVGFDATSVTAVTWGATIKASTAFHLAYCDEAYAVLSPDWFGPDAKTPAGLDLAALTSDLSAIEEAA